MSSALPGKLETSKIIKLDYSHNYSTFTDKQLTFFGSTTHSVKGLTTVDFEIRFGIEKNETTGKDEFCMILSYIENGNVVTTATHVGTFGINSIPSLEGGQCRIPLDSPGLNIKSVNYKPAIRGVATYYSSYKSSSEDNNISLTLQPMADNPHILSISGNYSPTVYEIGYPEITFGGKLRLHVMGTTETEMVIEAKGVNGNDYEVSPYLLITATLKDGYFVQGESTLNLKKTDGGIFEVAGSAGNYFNEKEGRNKVYICYNSMISLGFSGMVSEDLEVTYNISGVPDNDTDGFILDFYPNSTDPTKLSNSCITYGQGTHVELKPENSMLPLVNIACDRSVRGMVQIRDLEHQISVYYTPVAVIDESKPDVSLFEALRSIENVDVVYDGKIPDPQSREVALLGVNNEEGHEVVFMYGTKMIQGSGVIRRSDEGVMVPPNPMKSLTDVQRKNIKSSSRPRLLKKTMHSTITHTPDEMKTLPKRNISGIKL
jgi:hypothetical protein